MVVADTKQSLTITGNGDVLEPNDGIIGKPWSQFPWIKMTLASQGPGHHFLISA